MISVMLLSSFFFWSFNCLVFIWAFLLVSVKLLTAASRDYWKPNTSYVFRVVLRVTHFCFTLIRTSSKFTLRSWVVCAKRPTGLIPNPRVSQGGVWISWVFFLLSVMQQHASSLSWWEKVRKHFDLLSLLCLLLFSDMLCTVEPFQQQCGRADPKTYAII